MNEPEGKKTTIRRYLEKTFITLTIDIGKI